MRRLCMPREWPRQTVTAAVTRNSANAPQVNVSAPPIKAAADIPPIHNDFPGRQRIVPSTASAPLASNMRGERNVVSDWRNASSRRSTKAVRSSAPGDNIASIMKRPIFAPVSLR